MCPDEDNQEIKSVPPTRQLVAEYDRKRKERQTFEKAYKRQTFFIRRDLIKKLNDLCNNRPGFKTQFVNFALEFCLAEHEGKTSREVTNINMDRRVRIQSGELPKDEVQQLVRYKLVQSNRDATIQELVADHVLARLFPQDGLEETRLRKGERFQSPDVVRGKGKRYYTSARECVEDLVDYWLKNVGGITPS